jgi:hypothetical protein
MEYITPRDRQLLLWINSQGFVTVGLIAQLWGVDLATAARRVRYLIKIGAIRRIDLKSSAVRPLVVTPKGCEISGDTLAPVKNVSRAKLNHEVMLSKILMTLEARYGGRFELTRRVAERYSNDPDRSSNHLPDAIWHKNDRTTVAIELELTAKSKRRLAQIFAQYAADLSIDQVWYLTDDLSLAHMLLRESRDFRPPIKIVPFNRNGPAAAETAKGTLQ